MSRTKTTITPELINQVEELSSQGFNNVMISQSLNIGRQTLSTNKDLKDSIQRGKLTLSKQVTQTVLDTLESNPTNMQMLVKRLGLFNQSINISKPYDAASALKALSIAIKQYSDGEISESQTRTIEATLNSYIKGYEITELEARLKALEDANS